MTLLLLGTKGCHLCELAEELIDECLEKGIKIHIERIDIAEQTEWQQDYATLIPVLLQKETAQTLNWPFTKADVLTFIEEQYG
ncbi:hypothetical protein MCAMS1_02438 [biofilm metagenome]